MALVPSLAVMQRSLERWRASRGAGGAGRLRLVGVRAAGTSWTFVYLCQHTPFMKRVLDRTLARMLRDKQVTREWRRNGGTRWYVWSLYHGGAHG